MNLPPVPPFVPGPYEGPRLAFGLTQARMAAWLRVSRALLSQVEIGRRHLPVGRGMQEGRLDLAARGLVYNPTDQTITPAPPALPLPAPRREPLARRLKECRYRAWRLRHELEDLRRQAAPLEARYTALPALRAWTGPVEDPEREARWLDGFEQDAQYALQYTCGAGPQRLLEARIAGLDREAELLEELLAQIPPEPVAPPPPLPPTL